MPFQHHNIIERLDRRITVIERRICELSLHKEYVVRMATAVRVSDVIQTQLESELQSLMQERRFECHRALFAKRRRWASKPLCK